MRATITVLMLAVAMTALATEPTAYWRFDELRSGSAQGKPLKSEVNADTMAARAVGAVSFSRNVAAPHIYDAVSGKSVENRGCLRIDIGGYVEVPFQALDGPTAGMTSFTAEMYVFPDADPCTTAFAFRKARLDDTGSALAAGINYSPRWQQSYFGGSFRPVRAGAAQVWHTGPYTSIARVRDDHTAWRHLAITYDAGTGIATCYLDHWQVASKELAGAVSWDDGSIYIGGGPDGESFIGLIDEVRLTRAVLTPPQFLWARETALSGVRFESTATLLPRDIGYIDVKSNFGAAGDGVTDDTLAFQNAFAALQNQMPLAYHTLYVPPGTYLISDTIRWTRFLTLQGAGRDLTVIRLKDKASGFGDPDRPKPLLKASSTSGSPGSNKRTNGSSMENYAFDLTLSTGSDNAGAVGFEYHSNNHGALRNVTITAADGQGAIGLDLRHNSVGPSLIKNVTIGGYQYGVRLAHQEYSMTFEDLVLKGQSTAGIHNQGNIIAINGLRSQNRVPAVICKGANSMATLLNATLAGGVQNAVAIEAEGGLYARDIKTQGYGSALLKRSVMSGEGKDTVWREKRLAGPTIAEFVGDRITSPRGDGGGALKLPVEATPEPAWGDPERTWVNVHDFADRKSGDDWGPAIQAAIDSGSSTVYFPWGKYMVNGTVRLRGEVTRLFGMRGKITRPKAYTGSDPVLIYDNPNPNHVVVLDRLGCAGLQHLSAGTLVIRHASPEFFVNGPGCGKLFLEDVVCADFRFEHPQHVWARHWDVERQGAGPSIISKGATIWSLGFKTEYESEKLRASNGARTEILGAFIYPIGDIPEDRPMFRNTDSQLSLVYGTSVYDSDHKVHIIDTQHGAEHRVTSGDLMRVGSRGRMDLYTSHMF